MTRPIWMALLAWLPACGGDLNAPSSQMLEVRSVTTGQPTDPDGYLVQVDGGRPTALGVNETIRLADLVPGRHQVELEGVAPNCTVTGSNPRSVSVRAGDVTPIQFDVQCGAPTGSVEVTITTTGDQPDPDGYVVSLDGSTGLPVGTSGTVSITSVAPGAHEIRVGGLAANCVVSGGNLRHLTVESGPVHVDLEIRCNHPAGTISVTTTTTGPRPDPDGYELTIAGATQHIASSSAVTVSDLPPGIIDVRLDGLAPNCWVDGVNPRSVGIFDGQLAMVTFVVGCLPTGEAIVLFSSDRSGVSHLYRVREDGNDLRDLTPGFEAAGGDWSPDGSRIVFTRTPGTRPELTLMDPDGRHQTRLGVSGAQPRWSPDGRRIAFTDAGGMITVIDADGTGATPLVAGNHPNWSPDGTRIVFDRVDRGHCAYDFFCASNILVVNADGSGEAVVAAATSFERLAEPAWSPDGSEIAYRSACCFIGVGTTGVYATNPTGGGARVISQSLAVQGGPVWSPDGSLLLVAAQRADGTNDLMMIPGAGGAPVALAPAPGHDHPQAWR
jgi:hypothetical protein